MSSLGVRHDGGEPAAAGRRDESRLTSVGIRELARNVSGVVAEVARTRRPAVVTKHGEPVAAVIPLDSGGLDQAMLRRASKLTGPPGPARRAPADAVPISGPPGGRR